MTADDKNEWLIYIVGFVSGFGLGCIICGGI